MSWTAFHLETALLSEEVTTEKARVNLIPPLADLPYVERLKDVPDGQAAFVTGSSGLGPHRFVEIVVQRGNAAEQLGLNSGDPLTASIVV